MHWSQAIKLWLVGAVIQVSCCMGEDLDKHGEKARMIHMALG